MKKEYIEPTMDVVEIKGTTLLTGSLPVVDDTTVGGDDVLAPSLEDELNPLNELFAF